MVLGKEEREQEAAQRGEISGLLAGKERALLWISAWATNLVPHLLHELFPTIPLWLDFGLVAALVLLVGLGFIVGGGKRAKDIRGVPQQTVETIRENMEWIQRKL